MAPWTLLASNARAAASRLLTVSAMSPLTVSPWEPLAREGRHRGTGADGHQHHEPDDQCDVAPNVFGQGGPAASARPASSSRRTAVARAV